MNFSVGVAFTLSSGNAFSLDKVKILLFGKKVIENTYIVLPYIKISNEVGRIDNIRALARKLSILPTNISDIQQHNIRILFIFQSLICLRFIISNTDKHESSSICKSICCCNDVMNNADCVIKRDVYQKKMHSCSKKLRGIQFFVLKYL